MGQRKNRKKKLKDSWYKMKMKTKQTKQTLWDTVEAVLTGKFIAPSTHVKNFLKAWINDSMIQLKNWKNENKPNQVVGKE